MIEDLGGFGKESVGGSSRSRAKSFRNCGKISSNRGTGIVSFLA
jgi:hypothetical protein